MKMELAQVVNKGMQRDYSMNTASQEFAYENKNIRITTTGNESFLAVTNEKSTVPIKLQATGLPYRDKSKEDKINSEILKGHKLCFINVKHPTEIGVYFTRLVISDEGSKVEQGIPHKVLVSPGVEETDKYGIKKIVTYTDITENFDELLNVEGAKEVHILPDFYFATLSGYVPIGENAEYVSNFFNDANIYGSTICGEYLVLFTNVSGLSLIFRAKFDHITSQINNVYCELVYSGSLSFGNSMEFISYYESDDVQKVYWVDGVNQPRVINIMELHQTDQTSNLDFVPKINNIPTINIEKQYNGAGVFPSGVIQYYITYYKKYGQETNAVYTSPLYSISPEDRGGNEDETQTCSFKLTITNVDTKYDYIRVYSFIRTSLDADPIVAIVNDLNIYKDQPKYKYELIDTNINNINVAATDILFLADNTISASTIEQKDNTLFLGNISSIVNNDDYTELKDKLKINRDDTEDKSLQFFSRPVATKNYNNGDYGYAPNMEASSKDKGFKYLEWYRFGLQFQSDTGEWSSTIWLKDIQNNISPNLLEDLGDANIQKLEEGNSPNYISAIRYNPSKEIKDILQGYNSKYYRLVMAEHNNNTRTIKTQGIVLPSIFNIKKRSNNTEFGSAVWNTSMLQEAKHLFNIEYLNDNFTQNDSGYYMSISPLQQLDSVLYDLPVDQNTQPSDGDKENTIVKNPQLRVLPNTILTTKEHEDPVNWYVSRIHVELEVDRLSPSEYAFLKGEKRKEIETIFGSNNYSLYLDWFFGRIYVYIKNYNDKTEVLYGKYVDVIKATAGKRQKQYELLWSKLSKVTFDEFKAFVKKTKISNGINEEYNKEDYDFTIYPSLTVISRNELITVKKFHDKAKQKRHIWSKDLYRNGTKTYDRSIISNYENQYFIDANTCNLWAPNIDELTSSNAKLRLVGYSDIINTISSYDIVPENAVIDTMKYEQCYFNFNRNNYDDYSTGITTYPIWPASDSKSLMWVFPFNQKALTFKEGEKEFEIKTKKFGNFWKCSTSYLENDETVIYNDIYSNKCDDDLYIDGSLYVKEHQNVLFPKNYRRPFLYSTDGIDASTELNVINGLIAEKDNIRLQSFKNNHSQGAVNIKYSSTPHMVLELNNTLGYSNILPSYIKNGVEGTADVVNNTTYPTEYIPTVKLICDTEDEQFKQLYDFINTSKSVSLTIQDIEISSVFINDVGRASFYFETIDECSFEISVNIKNLFNNGDITDPLITHSPLDFKNNLDGIVKHQDGTQIIINDLLITLNNGDDNNKYSIFIEKINDVQLIQTNKYNDEKAVMLYNISNNISEVNAKAVENIKQYYLPIELREHYGYENETVKNKKIYIGELYVDYDPSSFMGGNTENALELNTFIPISDPTPIGETIYGFEGDTYYQQWDCLRIYPTSEEDVNQIVDVISTELETYINLDGDTRKSRGRSDVINIRPDNMVNQINPVYSQSNNYITSRILDEKFKDSTHPLQYWWSLTKVPNSDIDTWTGVNLTSVAELDGDKGPLNKIKRWNNQLFAFQDKAIALINFNNQTTISTQEGLPVEIANSGKVSGHYYITTNNGCKNKLSIVESPNGLYFIDSYNTSINVLGDGIKSLSQLNLFQDWIVQKEKDTYKRPFKGFYDPIHKEVYFSDDKDCICYNELLQQFTSFYDYQDIANMFVANGHVYAITSEDKMYRMFEGDDYCNLFDKQCDYYMQYKVNHNPLVDKTWTNLEYRADIFKSGNIQTNENQTTNILANKTFDTLKVWNEYQQGELNLNTSKFNYLKDAKSRFRVWRTNIPRASKTDTNKYGLDRIRNPWIMLELKKNSNDSNQRMEFHDLVIKYVI